MSKSKYNINRREAIKGLAAIPVLGAFLLGADAKSDHDDEIKQEILDELNIEPATPNPIGSMNGDVLRVGIIGYGGRGEHLIRSIGFASPKWLAEMKENAAKDPKDTRLKDYLEQENLNVQLTAVCDAFDVRGEMGVAAGSKDGLKPKQYRDYRKMLEDPDLDAVVIATPDHLHAPMVIAAVQAGKHVYVEKCMTHKVQETVELYDAVKTSGLVFQLGHQHRQTASFLTARELVKKKVLGHINLVQTNTNRNDDNGAWQWEIHEKGNPQTIDWDLFLGNAPKIPFNAEHYFRWRKWWAYGTGLSGDLLTHDYDRINCVLDMGIPASCNASGGIYTHRDGRDVPDVFQVVMEYPDFTMGATQEAGKEKGMTFVYSATLGNQYDRGTLLMGHDATLELGEQLVIHADPQSTRYKDFIEKGIVNLEVPMYAYDPRAKGVDAVTGATAKYFANKGLMYTYRDGKRVDSTFLHLREWLSAIRNGHKVSCGLEEGFQEAISAHMASVSFRTGKRVEWDAVNRKLKNVSDAELAGIGML
ncbi:MAG: Gfo/Idh/MocA family oxidoreductase [Saprospiraceae bacterium]|nr:Gfo/Idh/MocA family oxidoreductase [Saprospiraceae bacterium]MCF8249852.1 Gfo/Idh/MocA family oxidoreductase [Saprospiraceae bacterium]MCF8279478.1 Gfo/Idh/MocA family oxidoreductase [Bacteroidales bacterium]MCF8311714.1 Gfo/Idh/MocA family oxidoreductase [Saprospiraceae bacterium]MCF8440281.1 Gfo/Idh/MocA family oxidoreductase [Saprospiraceae bacterium]